MPVGSPGGTVVEAGQGRIDPIRQSCSRVPALPESVATLSLAADPIAKLRGVASQDLRKTLNPFRTPQ